jgi:transcriptional regulator with XRE-family HTH domain
MLHRRRLGAELRRLRAERTLEEIADATLISTSKLSRLENGQGVPQPRDIRDLVNYFRLDTQTAERLRRWASAGRGQAWWREYSAPLPAHLDTYLDYETGASTIRNFALTVIPPLLQTKAYATQLYRALPPPKSEESVRQLVEARARRQEMIFGGDPAPDLFVVLDEAVLRRTLGSAEDTDEQLDHLRTMSVRRNIAIRVVPFAAGPYAGIQGPFTILQYADDLDRDIVAVESHTGERLLETKVSVLEYLRIFDSVSRRRSTRKSLGCSSTTSEQTTPAPPGPERQGPPVISDNEFRMSSFSGVGGCVEVRRLPDGKIALRDSKDPSLPQHHFTVLEWETFLLDVRAADSSGRGCIEVGKFTDEQVVPHNSRG